MLTANNLARTVYGLVSAALQMGLDVSELAETLFLVLGSDGEGGNGGPTPEGDISELENLESRLLLALSHVRMLKNGHAPVNRLPPEVMGHVFACLLPNLSFPCPFPLMQSLTAWSSVAHVCRLWRNMALACPSLWRQIHMRRPSDADALARILLSGSMHFQAYYTACPGDGGGNDVQDDVFALVGTHSDRLQELHVCSTWSETGPLWDSLLLPAPILERLTLVMSSSLRALPPLFADHTPRLKELTLRHISSFPSNTFFDLTYLALYDQEIVNQGVDPLAEFLAFLALSPRLEELILIRAGPVRHDTSGDLGLAPVTLPLLKNLEVGQWWDTDCVQSFLSHIIIPSDCQRCIWNRHHLGHVLPLIHNANNPPPIIREIVFTTHPSEHQVVIVKNSVLHIHGFIGFLHYESIFRGALLAQVEELIMFPLSKHLAPTTAQLSTMLQGLPSLKILTVSGYMSLQLKDLLMALGLFRDAEVVDATLLCPLLESLNIFRYDSADSVKKGVVKTDGFIIALLAEKRAQQGRPLRKVHIELCRLEHASQMALQIEEVELADRHSDEDHFEDHLLDGVWPTEKTHAPHCLPTHDTVHGR